jgi:hypothetical protein
LLFLIFFPWIKFDLEYLLEIASVNGAISASYVVSEILKSYWHNGIRPNIYYYHDTDKREIDVLLEENGIIYPIGIKKKSNPTIADIRLFAVIEDVR